jgi:NAD(P)-dependent dehydrogenase (short-subunit alcohol dehydrogenase family)
MAMTWTPDDLPDLTGTTAVVTGANSGIGFETACALVRNGATVTLACRNVKEAGRAAERIRGRLMGADDRPRTNDHVTGVAHGGAVGRPVGRPPVGGVAVGGPEIRVAELDLSSLDSVRRFAQAWAGPLNLLVNNAGVMAPRRWLGTQDGFELQFGTNHLGHFALTGLLLPALKAAASPRVVTVASLAHFQGRADLIDGNPPQTYRPTSAYGSSKLANVLFGAELQRQATAHGSVLTSTMAHPGVSATGLVEDPQGMGANPVVRVAAPWVLRVILQSAAAGANPILYAATDATPGSYTGPRWLRETRGPVGPARLSQLAQDQVLASRLWQVSEELTGVEYRW